MKPNIPAGLRDLAKILEKLKTLHEWAKLAKQEARPDVPPSFRLGNHLAEDIRIQYTAFVSTALDIREALNNPATSASPEQHRRWQRRLRQLEREAQLLDLTERFITA